MNCYKDLLDVYYGTLLEDDKKSAPSACSSKERPPSPVEKQVKRGH